MKDIRSLSMREHLSELSLWMVKVISFDTKVRMLRIDQSKIKMNESVVCMCFDALLTQKVYNKK